MQPSSSKGLTWIFLKAGYLSMSWFTACQHWIWLQKDYSQWNHIVFELVAVPYRHLQPNYFSKKIHVFIKQKSLGLKKFGCRWNIWWFDNCWSLTWLFIYISMTHKPLTDRYRVRFSIMSHHVLKLFLTLWIEIFHWPWLF